MLTFKQVVPPKVWWRIYCQEHRRGFSHFLNVANAPRTHKALAATWSHNLFFDAQMIEQHQSFKQGLRILIFQIRRASALWHNKAQESIKLHFPFNGKPALKHWDDLAG